MQKFLLMTLAALALNGCVPETVAHLDVNISGLAGSYGVRGAKYKIVPLDEKTSPRDLQFQEFARYLSNALNYKDMVQVEDLDDADIVVLLDYGVGEPSKIWTSVPVYGDTGIEAKEKVTVKNKDGSVTEKTEYYRGHGVVGYRRETYNVYDRYFVARAIDWHLYNKEGVEDPVWDTTVVSTGTVGDLRYAMPMMIAASAKFLGVNTGRAINLRILENDPMVNHVKGFGVASRADLLSLSRKQEQ